LVELKVAVQNNKAPEFHIDNGVLKCGDRLCVPAVDKLRQKILHEAHYAPYSVHPETTKMYHDVKGIYWWRGMKKDVAQFVFTCLTCQQVKFEPKTHRTVTRTTIAQMEMGTNHYGFYGWTAKNA